MPTRRQSSQGHSLIELLLVLAILSALTMAGVSRLGNRKGTAVRTVMDEVAAVLLAALKTSVSTGRSVTVAVNGTWTAAGTPSLAGAGPLMIDGRPFDPTVVHPDPYTGIRVGSLSEVFASRYANHLVAHQTAGVATDAASGAFADSLRALPPFSTDATFATAYDTRLCTGGRSNVVVDGGTNRFTTGFSIVVVPLASGTPVANGPMGVLVVTANSANVFRFYRSDPGQPWRRI